MYAWGDNKHRHIYILSYNVKCIYAHITMNSYSDWHWHWLFAWWFLRFFIIFKRDVVIVPFRYVLTYLNAAECTYILSVQMYHELLYLGGMYSVYNILCTYRCIPKYRYTVFMIYSWLLNVLLAFKLAVIAFWLRLDCVTIIKFHFKC